MLNYADGKVGIGWRDDGIRRVGMRGRVRGWADGQKEVCVFGFLAVPSTQGRKRRPGALKPWCPAIKDAS